MAVPVFMCITGYLGESSYLRKSGLGAALSLNEILAKLIRFVVPFFPVFILQTIVRVICFQEYSSMVMVAKWFLSGGVGPGSYYFPVMFLNYQKNGN